MRRTRGGHRSSRFLTGRPTQSNFHRSLRSLVSRILASGSRELQSRSRIAWSPILARYISDARSAEYRSMGPDPA